MAAEEDGRVLVDATDFYLRDAHNVVGVLKQTEQGSYKIEPSRCALYPERTKNFPQNTEVEVTLTFVGEKPGDFVRQVVPTPEVITVRQHHSFIQLPDDSYAPRVADARAGYFGIRYQDYATPISEPLVKRFIARHRPRAIRSVGIGSRTSSQRALRTVLDWSPRLAYTFDRREAISE